MGGGGSKTVLPPVINIDPYPTVKNSINNLSLSQGVSAPCVHCAISVDSKVTTSGVKLTRDFGDVSDAECRQYQTDLQAVRNNEMSFRDFFVNLQAGNYTTPISQRDGKSFCAQVMFSDEDAAKVTDLKTFDANIASLKNIRIRRVTGGGSFSSGTKAKFKLSIPIKVKYVSDIVRAPWQMQIPKFMNGKWVMVTDNSNSRTTPLYETIDVSMMTLYHPSPVRIENVQHDAVLSLNDPSDPNARVVILIPLKSSNTNNASTSFFNKIAKYVNNINTPDSVTGLYADTDIPTGNDWNIKSLFWLGEADKNTNLSPVTDAYYTWEGAGTYTRYEKSRFTRDYGPLFEQTTINYGWKPSVRTDESGQVVPDVVRYIMLQDPVDIGSDDLSFLTRSLPPTPPDQAIHKIRNPSDTGVKIRYKKATGPAVGAACGSGVERMTNPGPGDIMASAFTGGDVQNMMVDEKGVPLSDKESCDPFANNAKKVTKNPSPFTPIKILTYFFNFMIIVSVALGTWLALYFVANKDYDFMYRDFSQDAGRVIGKIAMQANTNVKMATSNIGDSLSGLGSLVSLARSAKSGGPAAIPGAAAPAAPAQ